ncbi:type II toxin-antitoxin system RelE/ParE family toxin [uncultured Amphritea sp.]|uniref:type II toxin-antitoxin system RelE/ParE family toxin n=1 Tax=uncultured Amphritea sp. TaxID=981605 RepID=UPI00261224B7|nr:type II toxin-antitoxin system RelE/ParE family toxin [uncultured Amphritea sp.]
MQVKWLSKALQNLNDEAEYIAKDDPTAAKLVVQRIFDSVSLSPITAPWATLVAYRVHANSLFPIPATSFLTESGLD